MVKGRAKGTSERETRRGGRAQLPAMGLCLSLFLENRRNTEMCLPLHKIHECQGIH